MLTSRRFKGTIITMLAVLLICVGGIYTVHAVPPKSGSTVDVAWYIYVYNVGLLTDTMDTNSGHYYKVRRRSSRNVSGTWEFAHKIREGWVLGAGAVVPGKDASIDGHIFLNARKGTQSKRSSRGTTYSDMMPGMYNIEAYTSISLQVPGKGNVAQAKVTDHHRFELGGEGP